VHLASKLWSRASNVQARVQRSGKMLPYATTCCFCSATHRSLICNLLSIYTYYGCTLRNY
jgi:hypothetical protein